jgi:hypothetical protein
LEKAAPAIESRLDVHHVMQNRGLPQPVLIRIIAPQFLAVQSGDANV